MKTELDKIKVLKLDHLYDMLSQYLDCRKEFKDYLMEVAEK